jgi:protein required for attachment to host cells
VYACIRTARPVPEGETTMIDETTVALVADASRAHLFRVEVATGTWTPLETFAKHVAAQLARSYDQQVFRHLIVVAPAEFIGMLRPELPRRVAQAVVEERTQDLASLPADELSERVPAPHE